LFDSYVKSRFIFIWIFIYKFDEEVALRIKSNFFTYTNKNSNKYNTQESTKVYSTYSFKSLPKTKYSNFAALQIKLFVLFFAVNFRAITTKFFIV